MKRFLLFFFLFFLIISNSGCQGDRIFNFDFEKVNNGMPEQWTSFGSDRYTLGIDSQNSHNDKYAAFIEYKADADSDFRAWSLEIPGSYEGKQITLAGYIRTENVTDGYAGLWMRIDPLIAFDNMHDRGVVGNTDWKKYEVKLNLKPAITTQIVVGGLLVGKGKMWMDDLKVTIDGKNIQDLKPITAKEYPARKDKEFDNGSGISEIPVNPDNIETLKKLGLIWGFLKYYHPAIAEGNFNWDYELFRIMPKMIDEKNQTIVDKVIVGWINNLGQVTENTTSPEMKDEIKIRPDLGWIHNSGFSTELTGLLNKIKNAERTEINYYIDLVPGVRNPLFKNESAYAGMKYPDVGYRVLSLYRYWNIIQYYFPYKNLIEEDWKSVLEEFIPRFINAQNETEYVLTTLEVIGRVHDTHANLWMNNAALNNYEGRFYASPTITFVEDKAVVTGFYNKTLGERTGMKPGDIITKINDKPVEDIIKEKLRLTPASNYPTQLRDMGRDLLRTNAPGMDIAYSRNGHSAKATLITYGMKDINPYSRPELQSSFKLLNGNIAYLYPGLLKKGEIDELWKEIKSSKGLIIDLRCYPSDFIVFSLGSKLVPQATPFVKFSKDNIITPGLFTLTENLSVGQSNQDYYKGKVVILINEITQSQAEYTAMALRTAPDATVIGSTTAGADGNVSEIILPGGLKTMISGIGIYYPDGRETQRVGIIPDIELRPTVKGIAEGRDELLDKAIGLIDRL